MESGDLSQPGLQELTWFEIVHLLFVVVLACYSTIIVPWMSSQVSNFLLPNGSVRRAYQKVHELAQDLKIISAVDEFAKYAKKKRELSRAQNELDVETSSRSVAALKLRVAFLVVLYTFMIGFTICTVYSYWSRPACVVPSRWIRPVDEWSIGLMSKNENSSNVSALFLTLLTWCFIRLTTHVTAW